MPGVRSKQLILMLLPVPPEKRGKIHPVNFIQKDMDREQLEGEREHM